MTRIDFFSAMETSASGLTAQRTRMNVASSNLANVSTTRTASGGPYQRKDVVLAATPGEPGTGTAGVEVAAIQQDTNPPRMEYDPGHPDANAQGYVQMPNVNPVTEMTDLITATRAYEANTTAINAIKSEAQRALDVLR
jgi:flagellar basal-body rod protein FlgC